MEGTQKENKKKKKGKKKKRPSRLRSQTIKEAALAARAPHASLDFLLDRALRQEGLPARALGPGRPIRLPWAWTSARADAI